MEPICRGPVACIGLKVESASAFLPKSHFEPVSFAFPRFGARQALI